MLLHSRRFRRGFLSLSSAAFAMLAWIVAPAPVYPASFVVLNTNDSGSGSLRQAILDANASPGPDTITFAAGTNGVPIVLTTGQLAIVESVTILGNGPSQTIVSGNHTSRIFDVSSAASVTISGLTGKDGRVSGSGGGGGISNRGTLIVRNSTVSGNSVIFGSSGDAGGGIVNAGALTVENSTVSGNSAGSLAPGGISGGGIHNRGTLTVTNSTISDNTAGRGGGISSEASGSLTITNSTVSGNGAHSFKIGSGGGVYNTGALAITSSTISDNSADEYGGGIFNLGTLIVMNGTVSGNSVTEHDIANGGGIFNAGNLTVTNSTLSGNLAIFGDPGGGIFHAGGSTRLQATIVAGPGKDCNVAISSQGSNIADDDSCFTGAANGDQVVANVLLGPRANNGGPTQTHALLDGSPALDAVVSGCPPPVADQRGFFRPQGGRCDAGAFERQGGVLSFSSPTYSVGEAVGSAPLTIVRTGGSEGTIGVTLTLTDGTASAPADYTNGGPFVLTFGAGETSKSVQIPIVNDTLREGDETVSLRLTTPTGGASLGLPSTATFVILDDDGVTPGPTPMAPPSHPPKDNEDKKSKKAEQQRQGHQSTDASGKDDVHIEGDVVEVHQDEQPPSVVIANRDGLVTVRLHCGSQCPAIRVGDYLEAEGEKQSEILFDATDVSITRPGR